MVKNKVTLVSLLIIIIAVAIYFFTKPEEKVEKKEFYPFISSEKISQIDIAQDTKTLTLTSRNNRWFLADNNTTEIAVQISKILSVFEFVNDAFITQKITKKESSYPRFDITDEKAVSLVFNMKEGGKNTFHLGKEKENTSQFVRKEGDPYVYLISKRLNVNFDKDSWFYKNVLEYDRDELDYIAYNCDGEKELRIDYDKKDESFLIKDVPDGKQVKDLTKLKDAFNKISIMLYLPRSEKLDASPVMKHELYFKNGNRITVIFLKANEEDSKTHYIDMYVEAADSKDDALLYTKRISEKYLFQMSWFDKNKFQREYDDFFEDKPEEKDPDNSTDI